MFTKLMRLWKDAELSSTQNGTQLLVVNAVYDVGFGDDKRPQWVEAVLWGKRAEKVAQYFTKGTTLCLSIEDLEVEAFPSQRAENGCAAKLKGKITAFDFAGKPQQSQQAQSAPQQAAPQQAPQAAPTTSGGGFDDFDDDIPF